MFTQPKSEGDGDCIHADNPGNNQDATEEALPQGQAEKACRFYALYDKVYRAGILEFAYVLVRANKGSAGIDGVTFAAIETKEGGTAFIAELEEALRTKTYKPDPVKRVMIPKSDGEILRLIQRWLKAPIVEVDKEGTKRNIGGGKGNRKGTPQAGVISPLSSNLYLHILDRIWERNNLQQRLGARIVRYADDIVILCRKNKSDRAMTVLRQILERLKLALNEAKTKIVNAYKGRFDFLGFSIWMGKNRRAGKLYHHVQPSKKSLQTIKDRVTELTKRTRTVKHLELVITEVNSTVKGWVGSFHIKNCSRALKHV